MPVPPQAVRYLDDPPPPTLRDPVALVAFGGWVDAGAGGTGAVRYLINTLGAQKVAEIDPEEFYSFTDTRPLTSVTGPGLRAVHWPIGDVYAAPLPEDSAHDLLLFVAPEPNLRWRSFSGALLDVLQHFGVSRMLCLGAILNAVHHRATIPLTGWATDAPLREALIRHNVSFTNYEGPTGYVTTLVAEAQERGVPAAVMYGNSPSYIQGVPNPRVSYVLLKNASSIMDVPFQLADLDRAGRALMRQVDHLLASQPELREQVERMLEQMKGTELEEDTEEESSSPSSQPPRAVGELPNPKEVVRDLEQFLKDLRRGDGNPPDASGG